MRALVLTAAAAVLVLAATEACAESAARKACEAKWTAYVRKLPALPPPGRKTAFIKSCMAKTSNRPTGATRSGYGATRTVNPPDPDRTTGQVNPPDPDRTVTPHG
jgi:hypothetical protein